MVDGSRSIRSDVVGPDGVVLLFHGKTSSVLESLEPTPFHPLDNYNFSLVSFRPSDLDDPDKVRRRLADALGAVVAGDLDAMFHKAASTLEIIWGERRHEPNKLREDAVHTLRQYLDRPEALDGFIRGAKRIVQEAHSQGIRPVDDRQLDAAGARLADSRSPLTPSLDRLFAAERVPFVLFDGHNSAVLKRLRGGSPFHKPTDALSISAPTSFLEGDQKASDAAAIALGFMILDQLKPPKLNLVSDKDLEHLPGTDYQKMKYQLGRKRKDIASYNRAARRPIQMFPDEATASAHRANTQDVGDALLLSAMHDPSSALSEAHHLLTHYAGGPEQGRIQDRFDHVVRFHDAAMAEIDRKIEQRLDAARLPPLPPPSQPDTQPTGPAPPDRTPLTPEAAVARADRFARDQLPAHYRLRVLLQPTPDHPMVLKLTDDAGHTAESTITTFEPDANRALDIKQRVQAHLLDVAGIAPYRGPMRQGGYNLDGDEFIPAAPARSRLTPKYGEYRLKLNWEHPREELSLSLGLKYSTENRGEAERRAEFVREQLAQARREHPDGQYLPLTKSDLADTLRAHVQSQGRPWHERTHAQIDQFPVALRFPFRGEGRDQESWLQVDALQTDGNPNYTWVLPLHVVVGGQRLSNASTHVNLHVCDRRVAEQRAIDTVNHLMQLVSEFPANARWAIDPAHPKILQTLSEAARAAAPHLLDTNRLTDIQNELRFPHKRDLAVRLARPPREEDGRLRFALGLFRGGEHGLSEPVLENAGNGPPQPVERGFSIPADGADRIHQFEEHVNRTFRAVIEEGYDPRSSRNYDREGMRKLKAPLPFQPDRAPRVMDDAIGTHLGSFPEIAPDSPHLFRTRARRPGPTGAGDRENVGFVGRMNGATGTDPRGPG